MKTKPNSFDTFGVHLLRLWKRDPIENENLEQKEEWGREEREWKRKAGDSGRHEQPEIVLQRLMIEKIQVEGWGNISIERLVVYEKEPLVSENEQ